MLPPAGRYILPRCRPTRAWLPMCQGIVSFALADRTTISCGSWVEGDAYFADPPFDPELGDIHRSEVPAPVSHLLGIYGDVLLEGPPAGVVSPTLTA
jgi:hypothetical protein